MARSNRIRSDLIFDAVNNSLLFLVLLAVLYPLYFVLISSLSDPQAVNTGEVLFLPVRPTLTGYAQLVHEKKIVTGYRNTIIYTTLGTTLNVSLTLLAGYALSRRDLPGRNLVMGFMVFTMYFSGGLIPTYMLVSGLGLVNTPAVMILLGAVSVYNVIISRSYFLATVSSELTDACAIDGCGHTRCFVSVVLPLSGALTAVLVLYYSVSHWSAFFTALIYLSRERLYPLQLVLREILISSQANAEIYAESGDSKLLADMEKYAELVKFTSVVVATAPILVIYPFIQRYFSKGVMIGSVKG